MHVWKLRPIDPSNSFWGASTHKGEVMIRAASERRARDIADRLFAKSEDIIHSPWKHQDHVACERLPSSEFADVGREAIISPAYYDAEFQQMTGALDFERPIEVIDVFGHMTPAEYVRHQLTAPDCYEIQWQGRKWTVDAANRVQGPTDEVGAIIDPDFRVRNRHA